MESRQREGDLLRARAHGDRDPEGSRGSPAALAHKGREHDHVLPRLQRHILDEREQIKVLGAEWSSLARPDRLQKLAQENLKLKPVTASQFVSETELANRVPAEPIVNVSAQSKDPIADILKEMQ